MSGSYWLYFAGVLLVLFCGMTWFLNRRQRTRIRILSESRAGDTGRDIYDEFAGKVSPGLVNDVVLRIYNAVGMKVPVRAEDRLVSDYGLDLEDVMDMVEKFVAKYGIALRKEQRVVLPDDPSVRELISVCSGLADRSDGVK